MKREASALDRLDSVIADAVFLALQSEGEANLPGLGRFEFTRQGGLAGGIAFKPEDSFLGLIKQAKIGLPPSEKHGVRTLLSALIDTARGKRHERLSIEPEQARSLGHRGWEELAHYDRPVGRSLTQLCQHIPILELPDSTSLINVNVWPKHRPQIADLGWQNTEPSAAQLTPLGHVAWRRLMPHLNERLVLLSSQSPAARHAGHKLLADLYKQQGRQVVRHPHLQAPELQMLSALGRPDIALHHPEPVSPQHLLALAHLTATGTPVIAETRLNGEAFRRLWHRLPWPERLKQAARPLVLDVEITPAVCPACSQPDHLLPAGLVAATQALPLETRHAQALHRPHFQRAAGCSECQNASPESYLLIGASDPAIHNLPPASLQRLVGIWHGLIPSTAWV